MGPTHGASRLPARASFPLPSWYASFSVCPARPFSAAPPGVGTAGTAGPTRTVPGPHRAGGPRLTRGRFRDRWLTAAARVTLGGRRIRIHVADRHVLAWMRILKALAETHPIRGSPALQARPLPAA